MTLTVPESAMRLFVSLIVVLTMAACGQSSDSQPSPVVLTESASGSTVVLRQGQTFSVSLRDNPTTGFTWEIVPGYESYLSRQGTSQYQSDNSNASGAGGIMTGVGGVRTFTFTAVASGNFKLKLIYRQPWMTDSEPARTFEVIMVLMS